MSGAPRLIRVGWATCLVAVGLGVARPMSAQGSTDRTDVQGWYAAKLTLDLPSKWEAGLQWRARYDDDVSSWRGAYVTTDVAKEIGAWTIEGSHRLAVVDGDRYHRVAAGGSWERRSGATRFTARALLQRQLQVFDANDETGTGATTFLRTRVQLRRTLSPRLSVYASLEPYFAFGADYPIDNWRNTVGTRWSLGGGRTMDVYYIYRPDYSKAYNRTFHVIGVDLDATIKVPRRR